MPKNACHKKQKERNKTDHSRPSKLLNQKDYIQLSLNPIVPTLRSIRLMSFFCHHQLPNLIRDNNAMRTNAAVCVSVYKEGNKNIGVNSNTTSLHAINASASEPIVIVFQPLLMEFRFGDRVSFFIGCLTMKNELLLIVLLNNAPQISCKQKQQTTTKHCLLR